MCPITSLKGLDNMPQPKIHEDKGVSNVILKWINN